MLEQIQLYFGVGKIYKQGKNAYQYRVSSIKDLNNCIIPHFINYPLIGQKRADFDLFKQAVDLINQKKHVTYAGLQEILNIKAAINMGIPESLKAAFPNTKPVNRPLVQYIGIPDAN